MLHKTVGGVLADNRVLASLGFLLFRFNLINVPLNSSRVRHAREDDRINAMARMVFCIWGGRLALITASVISTLQSSKAAYTVEDALLKFQSVKRSGINLIIAVKISLGSFSNGSSINESGDGEVILSHLFV